MEHKIEKALEYYTFKSNQILEEVNTNKNLTVDQVIAKGKKLAELEFKITALEVAKSS